LRDDVKDLFNNLINSLKLKTNLLNSLLENEKSASDLIKNRNDAEDDILKIIDSQTDLIEEINVEDFNISRIRDEIIRKYRFDFNKIFQNKFTTTSGEILNYKKEIMLHNEITDKIQILKKSNNTQMVNNQIDLEKQISELERIGKIQIVFPKDPQSF